MKKILVTGGAGFIGHTFANTNLVVKGESNLFKHQKYGMSYMFRPVRKKK